MRALFNYLLPATFLLTLCSIGYGFLTLAGVVTPVERWWLALGQLGPMFDICSYIIFIALFAWIGQRKKWRVHARWLLEMNSRRGLRLAGIAIVDLLLLGMLLLAPLLLVPYASAWLVEQTAYLTLPLALALAIALLRNRPDPLDDVIAADSIELDQYANDEKHSLIDLRTENGLKNNANPPLRFGETIMLPEAAAGQVVP
jgi:hypothetical protein